MIALSYDENCVVLGDEWTNETDVPAGETWAFDMTHRPARESSRPIYAIFDSPLSGRWVGFASRVEGLSLEVDRPVDLVANLLLLGESIVVAGLIRALVALLAGGPALELGE